MFHAIVLLLSNWLAGALSDRWGRVRVLQFTILWYAVFTFLCGFAQDFNQLFLFRALQGLGFGGEWAAGAVLMGEVIQDRYRGRAVGLVQTGWAIGWGAAAILYTLLIALLPEEYAWRSLFWIGLAPAVLVFWIRRFVQEPEIRRNRQAPAGVMHLYFQVLLGELSCSGGEEDRGGRRRMQFFEHSLVFSRACVGAGLRG